LAWGGVMSLQTKITLEDLNRDIETLSRHLTHLEVDETTSASAKKNFSRDSAELMLLRTRCPPIRDEEELRRKLVSG